MTVRKLFLLLPALAMLSGVIALWQTEVPPTQAFTSADNPWRLPDLEGIEHSVSVAYERLREHENWRGEQVDVEPVAVEAVVTEDLVAKWQFLGTVDQTDVQFALIGNAGKVDRYRAGDRLPGDALLVSVGVDHIRVKLDDVEKEYEIFGGNYGPELAAAAASRSRPKPKPQPKPKKSATKFWWTEAEGAQ